MTRPMSIEMINEHGRNTVMISIEGASVLLDPADVDAVIQYLSLLRASMQPPVPESPSRSEKYVVEMDPCWYTEQHALYGGAVLFLRHTGLGWSGFALPPLSLERLHESLGHHLEELRESSSLPNCAAGRARIRSLRPDGAAGARSGPLRHPLPAQP